MGSKDPQEVVAKAAHQAGLTALFEKKANTEAAHKPFAFGFWDAQTCVQPWIAYQEKAAAMWACTDYLSVLGSC